MTILRSLVCVSLIIHTCYAIAILKDLAGPHGIMIGTAANYYRLSSGEANYTNTCAEQYNVITPENCMKWAATEPQQGKFDYSQGDYLMAYAKKSGQKVRGHNLCWGVYNPDWLTNGKFNASQLESLLTNHIANVAGHYKGQLYSWDVVNEAVSDNPTSSNFLKTNVWYPTLPNYIDVAFKAAAQADPTAKLFYNDYSGEWLNAKSDATYNLIKGMKDRGVKVDGVGFQCHFAFKYGIPNFTSIAANIKRFVALGLEVHITEFDFALENNSQLQQQGQVYQNLLNACITTPGCKSFQTWGFTDKYTWLGTSELPLPFDVSYQPKPAFEGLVKALQG
eukprot:TRINITY_DN3033_c0_g1_i1.p1 TRINITY_DN3033_c0_g1~~TRINITY_DN3033_c0_g1_i1.p1  ORF type:complete len:349 (-),score=86.81 TRINITY_DN3033_c0_g1_i1:73-1080(-)